MRSNILSINQPYLHRAMVSLFLIRRGLVYFGDGENKYDVPWQSLKRVTKYTNDRGFYCGDTRYMDNTIGIHNLPALYVLLTFWKFCAGSVNCIRDVDLSRRKEVAKENIIILHPI